MDFIEEKTPKGYTLKILFNKWQFLAFSKKGESILADTEEKSLLHKVPLIIFVGNSFLYKKNYTRNYELLKIRHGAMILPYHDRLERKSKYIFLVTDVKLDMLPVRINSTKNITEMVKQIDAAIRPDFVIVDDSVSSNDVIIIKNRYRVENIIYVEESPHYALTDMSTIHESSADVNINVLSQNPVFLARVHLRSMNLSKINQLLLDFDLTALDTEYIISFIKKQIEDTRNPISPKNKMLMDELLKAFNFYHSLLEKNDERIKTIIQNLKSPKHIATYRTIISKIKSMFPGSDDQLLYTEYENLLLTKQETMSKV